MKRIQFIAEQTDGVWLSRWSSRAMPSVIRLELLFIYLTPLVLAGVIALFDKDSAISLAIILYLIILFKLGFSPARKLEYIQTRRAWSRLSDRAKTLLLGPKILESTTEGIRFESVAQRVFWKWLAIDRIILLEDGVIFTLVSDRTEPCAYVPRRAFKKEAEMRQFYSECERLAQESRERVVVKHED